jgi:hypothetical protein
LVVELTPSEAYSTIMWDTIFRHAKFTVAFLVEASYIDYDYKEDLKRMR